MHKNSMVTVTNAAELKSALNNHQMKWILVQSGQYRLEANDLFTVYEQQNKHVIGVPSNGPVQIIGRMTWSQCRDCTLENLCLRAPIENRTDKQLNSYDCLTLHECDDVTITRCSIMGGADETLSIIKSKDCRVYNSLVGCAFATTRNHDMAILVSCDGFELVGCVVTGADRRKPQVQEHHGGSMLIADNMIDCGQTMTIGLKPQSAGFSVDIVNNMFWRHHRTKKLLEEIEAVNGSVGVARVFAENNMLSNNMPAGIDWLTNGEHLEPETVPSHYATRGVRSVVQLEDVGPTVPDEWHNFAVRNFGSGQEFVNENAPGFPSL